MPKPSPSRQGLSNALDGDGRRKRWAEQMKRGMHVDDFGAEILQHSGRRSHGRVHRGFEVGPVEAFLQQADAQAVDRVPQAADVAATRRRAVASAVVSVWPGDGQSIINAQSATVRVIGPVWSIVTSNCRMPVYGTKP